MIYGKDEEMIALKKKAGVTTVNCANELRLHPSTINQRFLGYLNWQPGERVRLYNWLQSILAEREKAAGK